MHKTKTLSLALALVLCLTLVMGLTVTGSTAKTKAKKKTVYVLVSAETKHAKKGNTFSTKLKYNKNGSVKLITSKVKTMVPVNPPKEGENPPAAPAEAPGDQSANPPAPPEGQSANPPSPPSDLKEVKYKRTTKVAYLKNKKVASIKSYRGKKLMKSMKYQYNSKTGLMKGIKAITKSELFPKQNDLYQVSKRDKKNRIDTIKMMSDGKKSASAQVRYKYNKKNLPVKVTTTVSVNKKPVKVALNFKYDKHNIISKVDNDLIQTNKYNKKGLLVKQVRKKKEPFGLYEDETFTFNYKKIKVSSDVAEAVMKQQWALQNMDELNSPLYDEMLFYTK